MKDLSGLEVLDYFRILWSRRWYFLIVFALVSIGGSVYARRKPDVYRSEARIVVDTSLSAVSRSSISERERVEIIREQLSSRRFLERMIQQTGAYGYGEDDKFILERAVDAIRRNINVSPSPISNRTFTISYRATDPVAAQTVTRQFTQELIRVSRQSTESKVMTIDRFLEQKVNESERQLREQNEKISEFKQKHAGKLPEQVVSNTNAIAGLRTQFNNVENTIQQAINSKENLEYDYEERRRIRDQLSQISSTPSASPVITRGSSPEERELAKKMESLNDYEAKLTQALDKYTENHPDIPAIRREIGRLEKEIKEARAKISHVIVPVETAENEVSEPQSLTTSDIREEFNEREYRRRISAIEATIAKREEERDDIRKKINEYESWLKTAPTLAEDLNDLLREQERIEKEYTSYATQRFSAGLTTAVETDKDNEVYRVVDEADLPRYPETSKFQFILMSISGGFVLGIGAAFARELTDGTIGSEEEAKKVLKLPVLAAIPAAPKKHKKRN